MNIQALFDSASRAAENDDLDSAAQYYQRALRMLDDNPGSFPAEEFVAVVRSICFNLAQILNKTRRYQEALHCVERGLGLTPTAFGKAVAFAAKGEALCGLGRPAEGKAMFEEAAHAHPIVGRLNSADAMIRLALPDLVSLAGQWVDTVTTDFSKQLDALLWSEVTALRQRMATKRSVSQSSLDVAAAKKLADRAIKLAQGSGQLNEASALMEEAFKTCPALRPDYEYQLRLWRRGVTM